MFTINGVDVEDEHLKDLVVAETVTQVMFIDKRKKEIAMELAGLDIARIVYANSLIRYVKNNPLDTSGG